MLTADSERSPVLYISRHGESEMNVKKIIGGNGNLSPNGRAYGQALGEFIRDRIDTNKTRFITSTLQRTLQTAKLAKVGFKKIYKEKNQPYQRNIFICTVSQGKFRVTFHFRLSILEFKTLKTRKNHSELFLTYCSFKFWKEVLLNNFIQTKMEPE